MITDVLKQHSLVVDSKLLVSEMILFSVDIQFIF